MFFQKGQPGPSKYATGAHYTSKFPQLTAEFTELLSDEPYLLNTLHLIRKSGPIGAQRTLQFAVRKKEGHVSVDLLDRKEGVSSVSFHMDGLSTVEAEIIKESEDKTVSKGVKWHYQPCWEKNPAGIAPFNYFDGYLEKRVTPAKNLSVRCHLRGGVSWVRLFPLRFNGGMGVMTEVAEGKLSKGSWAVGLDCQMRNSYLDLTGGRTYINTVIKYSCPQYAVCWNMQEVGERFVTSVVSRPGLSDALAGIAIPRALTQGWRFGGEVETLLNKGELQVNRLSIGLQKDIDSFKSLSSSSKLKAKVDFINGISQSYNVSVSFDHENNSSPSSKWGIGLTAQTSLMASGLKPGPAKGIQVGIRFSWM